MENERKDIKYYAQKNIRVENLIHFANKEALKGENVNDIIRMYKKCNIKMHNFVHSFVILLWT